MTLRLSSTLLAPALVFLGLVPAPSSRADEWQLTYTVTQGPLPKDPPASASPRPEEGSSTLRIALGPQYLAVDDGRVRRIYDFGRRRLVQLNLASQEFDDWSLYSGVGGRIRELLNRHALGAGLRAAKIPADFFGRFENETNLGLELPGMKLDEPAPVVERVDLPGGGWDFRQRGLSVVRFVPAGSALPAPELARFARFLAYECSLHPQIRRQLAAASSPPRLLETHWYVGNERYAATYRLESAARLASDSAALPAGFHPAPHREGPDAELFRAVALARALPPGAEEQAVHFADQAVAARRPLDACLALIEYGLQSGEKIPAILGAFRSKFEHDPQCQRYFAGLDQAGPEACRRSLASCDAIDRTGLQKAYMIDLQRADLLQLLGRAQGGVQKPGEPNPMADAEQLFLKVLAANPSLTGAYHDLGGLYDETFRSSLAWVCFDTARQLVPNHVLLREVTDLEQRMQRDFPDFF